MFAMVCHGLPWFANWGCGLAWTSVAVNLAGEPSRSSHAWRGGQRPECCQSCMRFWRFCIRRIWCKRRKPLPCNCGTVLGWLHWRTDSSAADATRHRGYHGDGCNHQAVYDFGGLSENRPPNHLGAYHSFGTCKLSRCR